MSVHVNVRLDDDLIRWLDEYVCLHSLENRSQAIRHAIRSTVGRPAQEQAPSKPVTKQVSKKAAPVAVNKSEDEVVYEDTDSWSKEEWDAYTKTAKAANPEPPPAPEVKRWSDGAVVE
jgi:Arc/MetJ-type ribon-helix-helix transcriptional regulator